jgi:hypothetical protein
MPSQVHFYGDWYDCVSATAPGESPGTHPTKWTKVQIPLAFQRFLIAQGQAAILKADGARDTAGQAAAEANRILEEEIVRASKIGRTRPMKVQTR